MKPLNYFIVELPKLINDTIKTSGGLELYVDTRFKEFDHRINEGKIVGAPYKFDTGAQVGDTLYFHHHVVINDGQPLTGKDDNYIVVYNHGPEAPSASQAYAYKNKDGEVTMLSGWVFLEPVEEKEEKQSEILDVVKLKEDPKIKGRLAFDSPWGRDLGIAVGDIVCFRKNMDYRMQLDGKEYYRVDHKDLLYVEEEV